MQATSHVDNPLDQGLKKDKSMDSLMFGTIAYRVSRDSPSTIEKDLTVDPLNPSTTEDDSIFLKELGYGSSEIQDLKYPPEVFTKNACLISKINSHNLCKFQNVKIHKKKYSSQVIPLNFDMLGYKHLSIRLEEVSSSSSPRVLREKDALSLFT